LENGGLRVGGVTFDDGSELNSMDDVDKISSNRPNLSDFTSATTTLNTSAGIAIRLTGTFTYDRDFSTSTQSTAYKAYYWKNGRGVLPISADGRSVDVSNASVIAERSAPTTVSINFYNSAESAFVGEEVYISNVDKLDINQMYAVKQLDPYSLKFRETLKGDFHEFFNEKQNAV
jgi:hypothetical protein